MEMNRDSEPHEWTREELDAEVTMPGGTVVRFGEMTVQQHEEMARWYENEARADLLLARTPVPDTPGLPAAIYARISHDKEGEGHGVDRQEADCRALAERLGWQVVACYVDNDISAYSGARRPRYEEMLKAVKNGEIKGIVAWHTDRLHRRVVELETFVSLVETHNVQIQTVTSGEMNLTTAAGRMMARQFGILAHYEVDHARERMKRAKDQAAVDGKYRGGQRPFGFEADGTTVREDEAEIIRSATKAVLAGRSLAAVARDLNEAGHPAVRLVKRKDAPKDAEWDTKIVPWTYARLRDVLARPRNAGLISSGRPDQVEIVGRAKWDAIVDEDSWRAVHALLRDPSRRNALGNDPRWLGSGIYTCGVPTGDDGEVCGTVLRASGYGATARTTNRPRKYLYRCTAMDHLTISMEPTDLFVKGVVADLVRDPRMLAAMHPRDDGLRADRELRTALASRLDSFNSDYAEGTITGPQLHKATATISGRLQEVDARLAAGLQRSTASPIMRAPDPGAAFLNASVDVQRAVLRSVLAVQVLPAVRCGAAWSSERLVRTPLAGSVE